MSEIPVAFLSFRFGPVLYFGISGKLSQTLSCTEHANYVICFLMMWPQLHSNILKLADVNTLTCLAKNSHFSEAFSCIYWPFSADGVVQLSCWRLVTTHPSLVFLKILPGGIYWIKEEWQGLWGDFRPLGCALPCVVTHTKYTSGYRAALTPKNVCNN